MTLPGWGRKVLLLAIIPVPLLILWCKTLIVEQMAVILSFKITNFSEFYCIFVKDFLIDKCIFVAEMQG